MVWYPQRENWIDIAIRILWARKVNSWWPHPSGHVWNRLNIQTHHSCKESALADECFLDWQLSNGTRIRKPVEAFTKCPIYDDQESFEQTFGDLPSGPGPASELEREQKSTDRQNSSVSITTYEIATQDFRKSQSSDNPHPVLWRLRGQTSRIPASYWKRSGWQGYKPAITWIL